jgi:ferredoxin-like protein FixX
MKSKSKSKSKNKLGYVIYEGPSQLEKENDIVCILTIKSANVKLGNMAQLWILPKNINPHQAIVESKDSMVCGKCPHRHSLNGSCYVLSFVPSNIHKTYLAGKYTKVNINLKQYIQKFSNMNLNLRCSAYGDLSAVPVGILNQLHKLSKTYTAYTHSPNNIDLSKLNFKPMISVENEEQVKHWNDKGYKTFRTKLPTQNKLSNELVCPATIENKKVKITCENCLLCGTNNKKHNIVLDVHGVLKNRYKLKVLST